MLKPQSILLFLLLPVRWVLQNRTDYQMTYLAKKMAILFWYLFPHRRRIGLQHLKLVFTDLNDTEQQDILKESYIHLGLTVLMALRRACSSPKTRPPKSSISIIGESKLEHALARGGIVFVSAHMGDWENLLHLHHHLNRELLILSKRLSNPFAQTLWDASRRSAPPRSDQGSRAQFLVKHLQNGGCLADVIDQHDPRAKARRIPFFGRSACTSPDIITFAERGQATLLPLLTWRNQLPNQPDEQITHTIWIGEALTPLIKQNENQNLWEIRDQVLTDCVQQIEAQIRLKPEQWLWIHRRWKRHKKDQSSI